jgi:S-methylmethionine-dependent homocysteine/selenocysteine methylase
MDFFEETPFILAEGSVVERLKRGGAKLHPDLAHAALIYSSGGRASLSAIHLQYIDTAEKHRLPVIVFTDTWRASRERVDASEFRDKNVSADNVRFLKTLAEGRKNQESRVLGSQKLLNHPANLKNCFS